jgi:hypothetical protein
MSATEKRTPAKPGPRSFQQWPADVVVEYGPAQSGATEHGFTEKTYAVYVNGAKIGEVTTRRERSTRPVSKGSRLTTLAGHPQVWRDRPTVPMPSTTRRWRLGPSATRAEATARLVRRYTQADEDN